MPELLHAEPATERRVVAGPACRDPSVLHTAARVDHLANAGLLGTAGSRLRARVTDDGKTLLLAAANRVDKLTGQVLEAACLSFGA